MTQENVLCWVVFSWKFSGFWNRNETKITVAKVKFEVNSKTLKTTNRTKLVWLSLFLQHCIEKDMTRFFSLSIKWHFKKETFILLSIFLLKVDKISNFSLIFPTKSHLLANNSQFTFIRFPSISGLHRNLSITICSMSEFSCFQKKSYTMNIKIPTQVFIHPKPNYRFQKKNNVCNRFSLIVVSFVSHYNNLNADYDLEKRTNQWQSANTRRRDYLKTPMM